MITRTVPTLHTGEDLPGNHRRLIRFDSKNPEDVFFKAKGEYVPVLSYVKASKDRERKNQACLSNQ
jgi:hypothetical protein